MVRNLLLPCKISKSCNWTAFNQSVSHQEVEKTEIGSNKRLLNAPADDYSTFYTAFKQCLDVDAKLQNPYTIIGVDQALFCKSMELKWNCPEFKDKIIICLGGLHVSMKFMGVIGKHVDAVGLRDVWV